MPADGDPFESVDNSHDVHIRNHQRNGRTSVTTVEGLSGDYSPEGICKALKKEFHCHGTVIAHSAREDSIIQLQGDQRHNVAKFLERNGIVSKDRIKVHGA